MPDKLLKKLLGFVRIWLWWYHYIIHYVWESIGMYIWLNFLYEAVMKMQPLMMEVL